MEIESYGHERHVTLNEKHVQPGQVTEVPDHTTNSSKRKTIISIITPNHQRYTGILYE
jgi:hypothetical protein